MELLNLGKLSIMPFDSRPMIDELKACKATFSSLLNSPPVDFITFRPAPEKWCLLEIACHLYDEEREDFRARVKQILETPSEPLPAIDPVGWVTERNYMQQNYKNVVAAFLAEREASITWLESLENPIWKNAYQHPKFGPISAKLILTNWVAHDYLHIRQILSNKHAWLRESTGLPLDYAGNW